MRHTQLHTWYLVGLVEEPNPEFFSTPSWKIKLKLTQFNRIVTFLRLNLSSGLRWSLWCRSKTTGRCPGSVHLAVSCILVLWLLLYKLRKDKCCIYCIFIYRFMLCGTWLSCVSVFSSLCPATYCRSMDLMAVASPSIDFGLGTRLKGTGSVLPSSK